MEATQVELGQQVEDRITGFKGTVTGIVFYLTGCNQALVVPRCKADGSLTPGEWFDLQRLQITDATRLTLDNGTAPGFDAAPTRRL